VEEEKEDAEEERKGGTGYGRTFVKYTSVLKFRLETERAMGPARCGRTRSHDGSRAWEPPAVLNTILRP